MSELTTLEYPDWNGLGTRVLTRQVEALESRDSLGALERIDLNACRKALKELGALSVAHERFMEQFRTDSAAGKRTHPLVLVWFQMQELDRAGCDHGCLNEDDVELVRKRMAEKANA